MTQAAREFLLDLLTKHGEGQGRPFERQCRLNPSLLARSDVRLAKVFTQTYGVDTLRLLRDAGLARYYLSDLEKSLSPDQARRVSRLLSIETQTRRPPSLGRAVLFLTVLSVAQAYPSDRLHDLDVARRAKSPARAEVEHLGAAPHPASCGAYLASHATLQCFRHLGGPQQPASPAGDRLLGSMKTQVDASTWPAHAECQARGLDVDARTIRRALGVYFDVAQERYSPSPPADELRLACSEAAAAAVSAFCAVRGGLC